MNNLTRIFAGASAAKFAEGYLGYLSSLLAKLNSESLGQFSETLLYARNSGAHIFFIGNGGSASTASHFANDLAIGTRALTKPLKAISLCDNTSVMTAIANDYGYDKVFTMQLNPLLKAGDVVVAISVSGNSTNIVEAVRFANARDAITVGITGFEGGALRDLVKLSVHVPTEQGEYGPAEDVHLIVNHLVASYLMQVIAAESSNSQAQAA